MAHEITVREDGFAEAAFAMEPAWHGLGTVFGHAMNSAEALSAAGHPCTHQRSSPCTGQQPTVGWAQWSAMCVICQKNGFCG